MTSGPVPMTISESAERLGALVWTEQRLFELLGGWVKATPEPSVKLTLARVSRHHGEHALVLAALLPSTRDHDPEAAIVPPSQGEASVAAAAEAPDTAARLAAVVDGLGAGQLRALEAYLGDASPVRDAPAIRVVEAVLAEGRADLAALGAVIDR